MGMSPMLLCLHELPLRNEQDVQLFSIVKDQKTIKKETAKEQLPPQ